MKKVELLVPENDVVSVTEALAASRVFHPAPPGVLMAEERAAGAEKWNERADAFAALERRVVAVIETLSVSEGSPPADTPHLIDPDVARTDVKNLEQQVERPAHDLEEEQRRLDRLHGYVNQLQNIADLEVELDALRNLRYLFAMVGRMPAVNVERLQSSLEIVPCVLVVLEQEDHLATVALFGPKQDAEILERAARSAYLNPLDLPETYRGTPAEIIEALEAGIERTRRRIQESQAAIHRLYEARIDHLRHMLWRIRASRKLVETVARYGHLHDSYVIVGWVPEAEMATFEEKLDQVSDDLTMEAITPDRHDPGETPVALTNPPLLRPFQTLVINYGYPSYSETDPTPVTALTFSLLFGVMFGDIGHGLLLALVGLLLRRGQWRVFRPLSELSPFLVVCGTTASLFGLLYGSVFGFEQVMQPLWMRPLDSIQGILLSTVAAGAVLIGLGMVYNMVNAALSRHWDRLLFDHNGLAGLLLYGSLVGLIARRFVGALPVSSGALTALLTISGLALIFNELLENLVEGQRPLTEKGVASSLTQGLFVLFETVISLVSNTLSFVRTGAFAVAHGALALVVLILARRVGPGQGLGYWGVVALGNLFIVGFEGLIVAIQTLRLEYYELFGKFFSAGGVRYDPLSLIPRDQP